MASVHEETELTYDADPAVEVPGPLALWRAVRADDGDDGDVGGGDGDDVGGVEGEGVVHHLTATYFDTPGLDLARAGLTLRRREGGDDAGWHLKVPTADDSRAEVRLPPDDGVAVPEELAVMLHARTGGATLRPVARVETERRARRLLDATGRVLLEVADDRVTGRRLLPGDVAADDAAAEPRSWREVEVELVEGDRDLLDGVDRELRRHGLVRSGASSKLARVLGPASEPADAAGPPGPDATAREVVRHYLAAQVERLVSQDLPTRLDAPDGVHAMRVASRRLRSALKTFAPLLDTTVTRPLRRELRWVAGVLGEARDAEVIRDRVTGTMAAGDDVVSGPAAAAIGDALGDAYRDAHARLVEVMRGDRYRELLTSLRGLAQRPPLTEEADREAGDVLPRLVARAYAAVADAMDEVGTAPDAAERDRRLHTARKAAKRARYVAEAVAPALGDDATDLAAALEAVQEALGEYLDAVSTRARLDDVAQSASPATAFALGRLHALEGAGLDDLRAAADAAWAAARKKRLRAWLDG